MRLFAFGTVRCLMRCTLFSTGVVKPDSTVPSPEHKPEDAAKGQRAGEAPIVVPVGAAAATYEPPVETLPSESGRQVPPPGHESQVDGGTEEAAALRQRAAHTVVEY